jgi:hypothetical protein
MAQAAAIAAAQATALAAARAREAGVAAAAAVAFAAARAARLRAEEKAAREGAQDFLARALGLHAAWGADAMGRLSAIGGGGGGGGSGGGRGGRVGALYKKHLCPLLVDVALWLNRTDEVVRASAPAPALAAYTGERAAAAAAAAAAAVRLGDRGGSSSSSSSSSLEGHSDPEEGALDAWAEAIWAAPRLGKGDKTLLGTTAVRQAQAKLDELAAQATQLEQELAALDTASAAAAPGAGADADADADDATDDPELKLSGLGAAAADDSAAFAALKSRCFTLDAGKYAYEVCLFGSAAQKEKEGARRSTSLGSFGAGGWAPTTAAERSAGAGAGRMAHVMEFKGGERCYNGPAREARVALQCAEAEALVDAVEWDPCKYSLVLQVPSYLPVIDPSSTYSRLTPYSFPSHSSTCCCRRPPPARAPSWRRWASTPRTSRR